MTIVKVIALILMSPFFLAGALWCLVRVAFMAGYTVVLGLL